MAKALEGGRGQGREPDFVEDAEVGVGPTRRISIPDLVQVE